MVNSRELTLFSVLVVISCGALSSPALFGSENKAAAQAGAVLFQAKGCVHCHGEGGIGGKKGPSLIDLRKNKEWTVAKITGQIMNGGQKMPAFSDSLSDPEIAQLVAYLRAKNRPVAPVVPAAK
jgi:mono/diheme cytochrome c family protein